MGKDTFVVSGSLPRSISDIPLWLPSKLPIYLRRYDIPVYYFFSGNIYPCIPSYHKIESFHSILTGSPCTVWLQGILIVNGMRSRGSYCTTKREYIILYLQLHNIGYSSQDYSILMEQSRCGESPRDPIHNLNYAF